MRGLETTERSRLRPSGTEEYMRRMDGKVAVITGGASGIGEATVRLFVREGARCVIADIQDDRGDRLATEMGGGAVYQRTDVTREDDVKAAIGRAVAAFGRLDCVFNNAGFLGTVGMIEEIPPDEFDLTMAVLLRGPFFGMKHAAPVMKAQGSGSIISTASIAGVIAGDGPHIYSTAKAALMHLTRSVALELAEHNIRVNAICPGGIVTPLITQGLPNAQQAEEMARAGLKMFQPIHRAGEPDDIASCALWLASDESTFVTGQSIVVDGGATAGKQWSQQPTPFRTHTPMRK
jgi:NAD(P)-dependent dehydrogenase (short-subunit alcohol dehydrogenase family)